MSDNRAQGRKKSQFPGVESVPAGSNQDVFNNGVNYKISYDNYVAGLGATGTIAQDGAVTGVPVLDGTVPEYKIRNIEDGPGIFAQVSAENGIAIKHNFTQDATGEPVLYQPTATSPTIRSLVEGNNISLTATDGSIEIASLQQNTNSIILVQSADDLSGTLDSTKVYLIDGVIDMGSTQIEVPVGGLNLRGYAFDTSKLISSENNYTMFTSPVGGSGNLLGESYAIEVTGTGSKVYDLKAATGNEAFEFSRINYNNCTSLGAIEDYRQGLETGTGRFGGQPSLELVGTWAGGYRITTSIVRGIDNAMTDALFVAGAGFTMSSRFLTDINADLGTLAPFVDFAPSNFPNASTVQIIGAIISRNGVVNAEDATIIPNMASTDLAALWRENQGIENTFVGGNMTTTDQPTTTISVISTFVDFANTFSPTSLSHFDSPANGELRNLGENPRDFRLFGDLIIEGTSGNVITVKLVKWDDSAGIFEDISTQSRVINNVFLGRDLAFFNATVGFTLDTNDYVKLQVANESGTANVTLEQDSFWSVVER